MINEQPWGNDPEPDESFWEDYEPPMFTVEEFVACVKDGLFTDDDGIGHPVLDGAENTSIFILPSLLSTIPENATYIIWYNK